MINSFPALFLNSKVAVVHKSKMAATTEPLKYSSEQKQTWNYIAGQTFYVDFFPRVFSEKIIYNKNYENTIKA